MTDVDWLLYNPPPPPPRPGHRVAATVAPDDGRPFRRSAGRRHHARGAPAQIPAQPLSRYGHTRHPASARGNADLNSARCQSVGQRSPSHSGHRYSPALEPAVDTKLEWCGETRPKKRR